MFEITQILWWLTQATIVGYLVTRKTISDTTNQIIFAPVFGLGVAAIIGNSLWIWGYSTLLSRYLFVGGLTLGLLFLIKNIFEIKNKSLIIGAFFCAFFLALLSIAIPYSEKVFQAYPLDKFFYMSASILYEQENINYFMSGIKRFSENGDKSSFLIHPIFAEAVLSAHGRPAAELLFIIFSWATPRDLHRLGHAWETFSRVLQFTGILAIFWNLGCKKITSLFFSLSLAIGFWFQYTKDFNAWSSSFGLVLFIASSAYLLHISNQKKASMPNAISLGILCLAGLVIYPELGGPSLLAIFFATFLNSNLRSSLIVDIKIFILEVLLFLGATFLAYPTILDWMKRQYTLSPIMIGGHEHQGRNIFRLFSSLSERTEFIKFITASPFKIFTDPAGVTDIVIGIFGLPYVAYIGAPFILLTSLCLISFFINQNLSLSKKSIESFSQIITLHKWKTGVLVILITVPAISFVLSPDLRFQNLTDYSSLTLNAFLYSMYVPNLVGLKLNVITSYLFGFFLLGIFIWGMVLNQSRTNRILINEFLFFAAFFFCCFLLNLLGGIYRTLPFWGSLGSIIFITTLWISNNKFLRLIAIGAASAHLLFGYSIYYTSKRSGMERYADWYSNSTALRHTEVPTVKDKYNYDYTNLMPALKLCKAVYINMPSEDTRASRFHEMNLIFFLENNHIPVYLEMPLRNASLLLGDPFFNGFKNSNDVNTDCEINEEIRGGKISYKLDSRNLINK